MVLLLKNKSNEKMIKKCLFSKVSYSRFLFFICFICIFIFSMYVMVYQAEKQNYITLAVEETGEYDYLFKVATKEQQSVMEKENYIKKLNL